MLHLAQLAREDLDRLPWYFAPGHKRRGTGPAAIDAMAIREMRWRSVQAIAHAATETAAFDKGVHFATTGWNCKLGGGSGNSTQLRQPAYALASGKRQTGSTATVTDFNGTPAEVGYGHGV